MISKTTFNRANRYRVEAPGFYAVYGALQGSDAIVHFALDGVDWNVKPNFWMQPWTLMSPTQMGQFLATAFIFRLGLLKEGELMADVQLPMSHALGLEGSPLVESSHLDELRKSEETKESTASIGAINPVLHLIGKSRLTIAEEATKESYVKDVNAYINKAKRKIMASTGEVELHYGQRLLKLTSPSAQGIIGNVRDAGPIILPMATVVSGSDNIAMFLVPLDGLPLAESSRWLLQIMTEERPTDFTTKPQDDGTEIITSLGQNPWQTQVAQVDVKFHNHKQDILQFSPLDIHGYPVAGKSRGTQIVCDPNVAYYLIEKVTTEGDVQSEAVSEH